MVKGNILHQHSVCTHLYNFNKDPRKPSADYEVNTTLEVLLSKKKTKKNWTQIANVKSKLQCSFMKNYKKCNTTLVLQILISNEWSTDELPLISFEMSRLFSVSFSSHSLFFTESFVCSTPLMKIRHTFLLIHHKNH